MLSPLLTLYLNQFLVFVLVLTRIGALVMTLPVLGGSSIPIQIRAFLAIAIAIQSVTMLVSSFVVTVASLGYLALLSPSLFVLCLALVGAGVITTQVLSAALRRWQRERRQRFDALYAALGCKARNELAIQAGARLDETGRLIVDDHQQTSVPGLFAAGDIVRGLNQISTAEGEAAIAATAIHNRLRGVLP